LLNYVYLCPKCGTKAKPYNSVVIRFKDALERGAIVGKYRYLTRYCKSCKFVFYVREIKRFLGYNWEDSEIVSEREFLKAKLDEYESPSYGFGAIVGEYTRRISRPVDSRY